MKSLEEIATVTSNEEYSPSTTAEAYDELQIPTFSSEQPLALESMLETLNKIKEKFTTIGKGIDQIKLELEELKQLKQVCDDLSVPIVYLRKEKYDNINELNDAITRQRNESEQLRHKAENERKTIESDLNRLETVLSEYRKLSSEGENPPKCAHLEGDCLRRSGFANIAAVREAITSAKAERDRHGRKIERDKLKQTNSLDRLESIQAKYRSLLDESNSIPEEVMLCLQSKGLASLRDLDQKLHEKTFIIDELERTGQLFMRIEDFHSSSANSAFQDILEYEQSDSDPIRRVAADARRVVQDYVDEHVNYLEREMHKHYGFFLQVNDLEDCINHGHLLGKLLMKLVSLRGSNHVFQHCVGAKRVEDWQNRFHSYYNDLVTKISRYEAQGDMREWAKQLQIAKALGSVDSVYLEKFPTEGFSALHGRYANEVDTQSVTEFNDAREYISKQDYRRLGILLSKSSAFSTNTRYSIDIEQHLHDTLVGHMRFTEDKATELKQDKGESLNANEAEDVKRNIEKIFEASRNDAILEFLGDTAKNNFKKFFAVVNKIVDTVFHKRIEVVQNHLDSSHFLAAERSMEYLHYLHSHLGGIWQSSSLVKNIEQLTDRLKNIESEINRLNFREVSRYSQTSPKNFLAELKLVQENYPVRYTKLYDTMTKRIHQIFDDAIKESDSGYWRQRSEKVMALENSLEYLPEEWKKDFHSQIARRKEAISNEERTSREELIRCLTNDYRDDDTAAQLAKLFERFIQQGMDRNLELLREKVINSLQECKRKIQSAIDSPPIQSAVTSLQKIITYREILSAHIPAVLAIYEEVRALMLTVVDNCCDTLARIASTDDASIIRVALVNIYITIKLRRPSGGIGQHFLSVENQNKIMQSIKDVLKYFQKNSESWRTAIEKMQVTEIKVAMIVAERYDSILEELKLFCDKTSVELVKSFSSALTKVKSYKEMCAELQSVADSIKRKLDIQFISQETILFPEKRDALYRDMTRHIVILREIHAELSKFLPVSCDTKSIEERLKNEIEVLGSKLRAYALNPSITSDECDQFRIHYDHLVSLTVNLRLDGIDIKTAFLDKSRLLVLEHVESLHSKFRDVITSVDDVAKIICRMKFFAENLSMFETEITEKIDDDLKLYKTQQGVFAIEALSISLKESDIGCRLITEHACFTGETWRKRRAKMQYQDNLDYVMDHLSGDDLMPAVKDALRACYGVFRESYDTLIFQHLASLTSQLGQELTLEDLITQTWLLLPSSPSSDISVLQESISGVQIPKLLAHIFAVWTLKNTKHYNESRGIDASRAYLLMPHVGQIIAIFRMLGIGYTENRRFLGIALPMTKITTGDLINNLVQIGTGEGKSVVMAVTACVFAMLGASVMCSCYSKYLSVRDQRDFVSLFRALRIEQRIEYGTFNELCESFLNEQCDLREKVCSMILCNATCIAQVSTIRSIRPKVLLIDEVDIFLSDKFYGGIYTPAVCVKSPAIKSLLDALWQNRELRSLRAVTALPAYKACATQFSNWVFLFEEAIKDMLFSLRSFQPMTYSAQNDRITYVDGESIVENVVHGYNTIWAYYYEHQRGKISENSLQNNVGIIVNCGTFSYAEMPHDFAYITGVTGTLETLAEPERNILRNVYGISKSTYMPSVFGKSNRNYNPTNDVQVVDESEYFMRIFGEINDVRDSHRAILVFFESEEKLLTFYNANELSSIKDQVQVITEKRCPKDRELNIKRAIADGKVTLLTRTFGRGIDFVCENSQLLNNGGTHVLQTFFSEELAEEYQIMGRGARQGDRGSYRMILLDTDLEWILGADWKTTILRIKGSILYKSLSQKRLEHYENKCRAKVLAIKQCKEKHKESKKFMDAMSQNNMALVRSFLNAENRGVNIESQISRTILLMDATGSMSQLLSTVKETVCLMFERAADILKEAGIAEDEFAMQFAVYRNYSSRKEKLLEVSPWESKETNLRMFMSTISPEGGMGNEAIEIGLWYAVQQSETEDSIDQVILIGDAPANTKEEVVQKRRKLGEQYWQTTEFSTPTFYKDELKKLKNKNIPVHTFYLTEGASSSFKKIAEETKGRCEPLDINSPMGAELLTEFVTEEVLRKAARSQGDAAVERYRQKHRISHI